MAGLLKPSMVCCLLPVWISRAIEGEAPQKRTEGDNALLVFIVLLSSEENAYDEYENELGITAIALYDYQAGEQSSLFSPFGCMR